MGRCEHEQVHVSGCSFLPGLLGRRHEQAEFKYTVWKKKPCYAACCGNRTGAPCLCGHASLAAPRICAMSVKCRLSPASLVGDVSEWQPW